MGAMNDLAPAAPIPGDGGRAGRPAADKATGVDVRPAATVMLVRDSSGPPGGSGGIEVLMLLRDLQSVFVPGAWVFPGGRVDDADVRAAAISGGRADAEASAALGVPGGGLAYWVAAVRECFEEAGILLARHAGTGEPLETGRELDAARFARHRRDVHAGRRSLGDVLAAEGLVLDLADVHYVSHWVTPPGGTRRFDTRFFVAPAPAGQVASHDAAETVESLWTTPATALERHDAGEILLVFPTIKNLQTLSRFGSVAELLEAARSIGTVPQIAPRFRGDPGVPASALDGPLPAFSARDPEPPCPT